MVLLITPYDFSFHNAGGQSSIDDFYRFFTSPVLGGRGGAGERGNVGEPGSEIPKSVNGSPYCSKLLIIT